jgi:hypothetical protein
MTAMSVRERRGRGRGVQGIGSPRRHGGRGTLSDPECQAHETKLGADHDQVVHHRKDDFCVADGARR